MDSKDLWLTIKGGLKDDNPQAVVNSLTKVNKVRRVDLNNLARLAIASNSVQCFSTLLKIGADIASTDLNGRTLLHLATHRNCSEIIKDLIPYAKVDDLIAIDDNGNTAIENSYNHRNFNCGDEMLKKLKEIINSSPNPALFDDIISKIEKNRAYNKFIQFTVLTSFAAVFAAMLFAAVYTA
jgi:ankyrin repeat protein